ncbi:MAG: hypothetical protein F9K13_04495 [Candidatus Methylomirabilis oxygeniifera]|uniref:Uncharacterized protein n=1 Tax=Methylomirabilis oxygeniifera TaxID=671143 RepID=D5MM96_METO1|nr:MAG: hypothetical protein F9K13_04495 [Candidatus Methylomirabilis oxyfera]CBE67982.1 protein of unknown function [Candidatus Methylomirabilis oxyfera]
MLPELYHYRFDEIPEERLIGFHALEQWKEESFRWSGPVATVRASLLKASYEVRIDTRSLRRAPVPLCLGVFFNRYELPASSVRFKDGVVSFLIQPSLFVDGLGQGLILTCNPVRPLEFGVPDHRDLGLPIFSIVFQQVDEEIEDGSHAASQERRM